MESHYCDLLLFAKCYVNESYPYWCLKVWFIHYNCSENSMVSHSPDSVGCFCFFLFFFFALNSLYLVPGEHVCARVSCLTPSGLRVRVASTSLDNDMSLSNVALWIEASTRRVWVLVVPHPYQHLWLADLTFCISGRYTLRSPCGVNMLCLWLSKIQNSSVTTPRPEAPLQSTTVWQWLNCILERGGAPCVECSFCPQCTIPSGAWTLGCHRALMAEESAELALEIWGRPLLDHNPKFLWSSILRNLCKL